MRFKAILIISILVLMGCNTPPKLSELMNETQQIEEIINKIFINTDNRNWKGVETQFADKVSLDYSSMNGNPAAELTPSEITSAWKTVIPGFTFTHHQIGNFITEIKKDKAHTYCYGTATHFLENENGSIWTAVGTYDFDLEKINNEWKVTTMTFNYKYQDGNNKLIEKAIENAKSI